MVPLVLLVGCGEPAGPADPAVEVSETVGGFRTALNLQADETPVYWGDSARFVLRGARPNEKVLLWTSFSGTGPGPCFSGLGGLCLDLVGPVTLSAQRADATGSVEVVVPLPESGAAGATIHAQVAIPRGRGGIRSVTTSTVSVPIENLPFAVADAYEGDENTLLVVPAPGLLANDGDLDGDILTPVLVTQPAHGDLVVASDGSFTYDPDTDFTGPDAFTYRVDDGGVRSDVVTVTLAIDFVNTAPTARTDNVFGADEDTEFTSLLTDSVLLDDTDPEGSPLTAVIATQPPAGEGTIEMHPDGTFTWTPFLNFNGETTFTYHAFDGIDLSATAAEVTLHIQAKNDVPVAVGEAYETGRDQDLVVAAPGLLVNDSDVDGPDPLSIQEVLINRPQLGELILGTDGSFSYLPELCETGVDSFQYKVSDGTAFKSEAVTVTVDLGIGAPLDLAYCDAFAPIEDAIEWELYDFEGFQTTSYVPANPVGLAFLFHGNNGDVTELNSIEWTILKNELIARGMAIVATDSTDRVNGDWDTTGTPTTNDEFPRLGRLRDDLVATTAVNASTPIAAIGFSEGGGFVGDFSDMALQSGWPMSVMAVHNSGGGNMPNLPAFFTSSENDNTVSPASVFASYNAHPGTKEYHEHLEGTLHPMLFMHHVTFEHQQSQDHFDALVAAGGIDSNGVRTATQMEAFLNDYEVTSPVIGADRVTLDMRVVWAMHRLSAEFVDEEADFILGNL